MLPTNPFPYQDLAKQFIWALRPDIRAGASASDLPSEAFNRWWGICARAEFPAWSDGDVDNISVLVDPRQAILIDGLKVQFPRAIDLALQQRPDVQQTFSVNGKVDPIAVTAWFFVFGIKELRLQAIVNDDLIRLLDQPIMNSAFKAGDGVPALTILMRLIWQLMGSAQKTAMPLSDSASRQKFITWFFCNALKNYDLSYLLAGRWRQWLLQEVEISEGKDELVPRFMMLEYSASPELQKRLRSNGDQQARDLLALAKQHLASEKSHWAWLQMPAENKPDTAQPTEDDVVSEPNLPANKPFGVNLFGFAYGELGIGEDLRMAVAACELAKVAYRVINVDAGSSLRQADQILKEQVEEAGKQAPYAVNIFCMPIFDIISRIFLIRGAQVFEGHYNIAWAPWELAVWPKAWKKSFSLFDEIWAGSPFSLEMYRKSTIKPSSLMPLVVSVDRVKQCSRSHFGLPLKHFLFLYVFDFNSHLERKNPQAAILAFQAAFPKGADIEVGLVLKVMNSRLDDPQWLQFVAQCKQDPRIILINQTMDRGEILGLIETCDAYISPHRAEGFGRTLAEAMLLGKPLIATNYSGNASFMHPELTLPVSYALTPLVEGDYHFIEPSDVASWANPSVEHMKEQLLLARQFAKDAERVSQLKRYAEKEFGAQRTADLLKGRMRQIHAQLHA